MKFPIFILCSLLGVCVAAVGQVEFASDSHFPADLEFRELQKIISEESFEDPARLSSIKDGRLIKDVGFDKYNRRVYSIGGTDELRIEIITLRDYRAAYSLLTLLRIARIQNGPPGDAYAISTGSLHCIRNRRWIRIDSQNASEGLLKRIALSICNRIDPNEQKPPALISHFPEQGYNSSSLQYFPGLQCFKSHAGEETVKTLVLTHDAEIARANYTIDGKTGVLFLMNFPTGQVAEDYFDELGDAGLSLAGGYNTYAKKIGPIIAILNSPVDSAAADKLLGTLRYSYSIRWVYEKKNDSKIIWGIPVSILGTVVQSLFFIAILAVISIFAGAGFAVLRFFLRGRITKNAPDEPERAEIIRLRLR
ncbi:MAG: hypothetical protein JXA73_25300 [Acidobacteria bacterium]|nr:hypothetical protein [Acidobacteriota bacterium]